MLFRSNVVTQDYFGDEVSWDITDANGNIVLKGGPYYMEYVYITHNSSICVPNGSYTFNWYDCYGDGWDDGNFQGEYIVYQESTILTQENPSTSY